MKKTFRIRRATMHDAHIIAWHRARMFQDMGEVSGHAFETLRTKAQARLADWLERGTYIGWMASPAGRPEIIVGGAGVQLQPILPRPLSTSAIGEGRQGTIVNVFTETEWRRRGVAAQLLEEIIEWSRKECLDRLVLHASEEGRTLYDRLGFAPSNEMRFVASTTPSPSPTATFAFPVPSSAGSAPTTSRGVSPRH
jgi:GNAT superfamily N-acetyltransferase